MSAQLAIDFEAPRDSRLSALVAATKPEREEQRRQITRVKISIGDTIVSFWRQRIGRLYRADELRAFVATHCGPGAPASADRVMRQLKRQQSINYEVVSRSQSLYRALDLEEVKATAP